MRDRRNARSSLEQLGPQLRLPSATPHVCSRKRPLAQLRQQLACYPGFFGVGGRKSSLHLLSTYDLPGQVQGQAIEEDCLVIGRTTYAAAADFRAVAGW